MTNDEISRRLTRIENELRENGYILKNGMRDKVVDITRSQKQLLDKMNVFDKRLFAVEMQMNNFDKKITAIEKRVSSGIKHPRLYRSLQWAKDFILIGVIAYALIVGSQTLNRGGNVRIQTGDTQIELQGEEE